MDGFDGPWVFVAVLTWIGAITVIVGVITLWTLAVRSVL